MVGTPHYMSPEQGRGEKIDARADLFSLGVLLYRMSSGQPPFQGSTLMAVLMAIGMETPPSVSSLKRDFPPRLSRLIDRLLAKKPADRPASAEEVITELFQIEKDLGREVAGGQTSSQAESAGMVIDDVLPLSDNVRTNRDDDDQTEIRPSGSSRRKMIAREDDDDPEVVEAPRRKRKRKDSSGQIKQFVALGVGAFMLLAVLAYFINEWRQDSIRKKFETNDPNEPNKTKTGNPG